MTKTPQISIEVDEESGRWSTDGLPMMYVPVHFFLNNHRAIEREIGAARYARLLYEAGYDSAWTWCESEARAHGISGAEIFHHYLDRLSKRGWGQFSAIEFDLKSRHALIELRNSIFANEAGEESHDYMYTGWFAGAMDQIVGTRGQSVCRQLRGERNGASGLFSVSAT